MEWSGLTLKLTLAQAADGDRTILETVITLMNSSIGSNTMEKCLQFMHQPICGRPLWETRRHVLQLQVSNSGMPTTTTALLSQTSEEASEDGVSLPLNSSKEIPPFAVLGSTKTFILD